MPMIDAHQHFWQIEHTDYGWLTPDLDALYRDFMPDDLKPLLDACGIDATVLVQAAPSVDETQRLLAIARETRFVAGVVGWAPFDTPGGPGIIEELSIEDGLVGLRPMIQDIADVDWMLQETVTESLRAVERAGLRFDALVKPVHLPNLLTVLMAHPDLAVVIDHGAKPDVAAGDAWAGLSDWKKHMCAIGTETGAYCKLSGLVTEATPGWTVDDLQPYMDVLLDAFGVERIMWGSDWPVLTMNRDYQQWWEAAQVLIEDLDDESRAAIFGDNAARFYGLDVGSSA